MSGTYKVAEFKCSRGVIIALRSSLQAINIGGVLVITLVSAKQVYNLWGSSSVLGSTCDLENPAQMVLFIVEREASLRLLQPNQL